ncbi:efflux RND transporter permease subunit, partial [Bacteroides acidifaciens]
MQTMESEINKSPKASAFTLIVAFVCVALVGLALVPLLPVKLNPSRTLPGFTVRFSMPGTSARVVEMTATSKLEAMLARVKGIRGIYSTSGNGWGSISVNLDKHVDAAVARFEASTIIRQTWPELPDGVSYPYIQMQSPGQGSQSPFMTFTINAPATPVLIQRYAEEHIKTRLAQLSGIYKINLSGATPMEWRLEYDSEQLRTLGISTDDIREAVRLHYQKEFMGTYDVEQGASDRQWIRLALVPESENKDFEPESRDFDAGRIQVKMKDGRMIG